MTVYCLVECLVDALHAEFPHGDRGAGAMDLMRMDAVYRELRSRAQETMMQDARREDGDCVRIAHGELGDPRR